MPIDIMTRLRALRGERDVSQKEVADAIGMSLRGYRNIEKGDSSPNLEVAIALADFFDVSVDYLVGRTNTRKPDAT